MAVSCGSTRKVQKETVDSSVFDDFAGDYFFLEGIRKYNNNEYDAAMDLISHSLDYDTASAAACYSLAQFYMSLRDRNLIEKYTGKAE